jgi:hypothetical protein
MREETDECFQAIADRVEIEALRGEFTDAVMMNDHDRAIRRLGAPGYGHIADSVVAAALIWW